MESLFNAECKMQNVKCLPDLFLGGNNHFLSAHQWCGGVHVAANLIFCATTNPQINFTMKTDATCMVYKTLQVWVKRTAFTVYNCGDLHNSGLLYCHTFSIQYFVPTGIFMENCTVVLWVHNILISISAFIRDIVLPYVFYPIFRAYRTFYAERHGLFYRYTMIMYLFRPHRAVNTVNFKLSTVN